MTNRQATFPDHRIPRGEVVAFFDRKNYPHVDFHGCGDPSCLCLELKENGDCIRYSEPKTLTAQEFEELYKDEDE